MATEPTGSQSSSDVEQSFNWLSREARGSAYVSYTDFSHKASCSFDFGGDGYAASCNEGGKIMHMTAKSEEKGIIFARGNFDSNLYASLARAQRPYGGESTFGLEVSSEPFNFFQETGSAVRLGEMIERGTFNHRWPYNEYALISNFGYNEDDEIESDMERPSILEDGSVESGPRRHATPNQEVGTCAVLSFIKDGVLYQLLRLEASTRWEADVFYLFPSFAKVVFEVGGSIKSREFEQSSFSTDNDWQKRGDLPHRSLESGGITLLDDCDNPQMELDIRVHRLGLNDEVPSELMLRPALDKGVWVLKTSANLTYDDWKTRKAGKARTVTFIASFRLRESTTPYHWTSIPTSEQIYKYIGISSSEPTAAAAMWETIFARRERATGRISELSEDRLVARCLEKILHVDLVPASFSPQSQPQIVTRPPRNYPSVSLSLDLLDRPGVNELEVDLTGRVNACLKDQIRSTPLALVSNLFLQPMVDLKALFWKVRFLVKANEFLLAFAVPRPGDPTFVDKEQAIKALNHVTVDDSDTSKDPDCLHISKDLTCMMFAAFYQSRIIQNRIKLVVEYLFQALLQSESETPLLPDNLLASEAYYYYTMITLCYVSKRCKYLKLDWPTIKSSWRRDDSVLYNLLPADDGNFSPAMKERVLLLKWYHYGSIRELVQGNLIPSSWLDGVAINQVYRLKRDAVRAAKAKLLSHAVYVAGDEISDRLAFLAWNLGLEKPVFSDFCPATLASITAKRIREREFTREINPGTSTSVESAATCGPWEIHALCHHSRLMAANYFYERRDHRSKNDKLDEVDKYRTKFCDFITAESSVVPCWERKSLATHRGWLRSETTSVIGTTLLDICQKDFEFLETERLPRSSDDTSVSSDQGSQQDLSFQHRHEGAGPPIDWKKYQPPKRYHPEDFFNSLQDTPEIYRYENIKNIEIPLSLRLHLSHATLGNGSDASSDPSSMGKLSTDSIRLAISATPFSIIDITAQKTEQFESVTHNASHQYRVRTAGALRLFTGETWIQKFQGPVLPGGFVREPLSTQDEQREEGSVARRLSDSLVDKGVQHRILAVRNSRSELLIAHFVYVFHPESADAFSDNISRISQFSHRNRGSWATNITLRSWSFIRTQYSFPEKPCLAKIPFYGPSVAKSDGPDEDAPIELPIHLHEALRKFQVDVHDLEDSMPGQILLNVSSIVISTNEFGDFSKCSIISELMTEKVLQNLEKQVPLLWQYFIHQPQTGRCLVFLLILSHLCQAITLEYQQAMEYLTSIINIEDYFLRGKQDWLTDQKAIGKLQLALWSLESLYKLRNTLTGSLTTIKEAKCVLLTQIAKGPGKRSAELESQCLHSVESFERSLGQLAALYIKVDRKTELGSRYRDSLSTVLSLNDSRSALQQSTTIQKLTYLTIAYLPVGLSAAIFAIPDEQMVVIPAMGTKWFLLCILILFVFTVMTATLMGTLLAFLDRIRRHVQKTWDSGSNSLVTIIMFMERYIASLALSLVQFLHWVYTSTIDPLRKAQNKSLEVLSPVGSSTQGSSSRGLSSSLTRRKSHLDDVEAGKTEKGL